MRELFLWVAVLWASLLSGQALGQEQVDPAAATAEAAVLYRQGQFEAAAERLQGIVSSGHVNGHVFYNLGNALYKEGDVGAAMAAYLAARRYLPRDPDVEANLNYVLQQVVDQLDYETQPSLVKRLFFWTTSFSLREQFLATMGILGIAFVCLGLALFLERVSFLMGLGRAILALGFVLASGFGVAYFTQETWGAIGNSVAEVYSAPSDQGNSILFRLNQGAPCKILRATADQQWYEVAISDGKKGWIPVDSVKVF